MKKLLMILPLALILCFMVGCQDKAAMAELEEFKAQAEVEEQNKALTIRYYEAWDKEDVEALKEIFSPDFVWHIFSGQDSSLEETIEFLKQQRGLFPDMVFGREDIIAKGDKVIVRYTSRGTNTGDTEDFPATGKKVEFEAIEILRVENGKIVECWDVSDDLSFYQQLGFELKKKEEEK
jgi:steroid delta-isomerase-like uncharacterized protein